MSNYNYPISSDWTTEEIVRVVNFYNAVEEAYERGVPLEKFKKAYDEFKGIVTSKSEEKQIGKKFETLSGYSIYRAVSLMKDMLKKPDGRNQNIHLQSLGRN